MDYIWTGILLLFILYFLRLQIRSEYEMESSRTFNHNGHVFIRAGLLRRILSNGIDIILFLYFHWIMDDIGFSTPLKLISTAVFGITYYILFLNKFKQTVGDMIFKIKTISLTHNQKLTVKQVVKRIFFHIVLFPILIFQIPQLRSQKKPFLPDKLSQTEIVQVKAGLGEKWINR